MSSTNCTIRKRFFITAYSNFILAIHIHHPLIWSATKQAFHHWKLLKAMPGIVFLSGGQTEMGKLEYTLVYAQTHARWWLTYIQSFIFLRCNKKSERNEQNSWKSMETIIQLLSSHSSICTRCMEGEFLTISRKRFYYKYRSLRFEAFNWNMFRVPMRKLVKLLCYIEQPVFDLPLLENMKAKKKLQLKWNHFSSKIIHIELNCNDTLVNVYLL